jgi:pimeloyl-ACP methyl ester carboxylesterase
MIVNNHIEIADAKPVGQKPLYSSIFPTRRAFLRTGIAAAAAVALFKTRPLFSQTNGEITTFTYHAPQSALDDLKQRLTQTRWPERETVNDWSQGVPLERLRALLEYWRTGYDWRHCEEALNRFPQYRTEIDGLGIHFLHVRSKHPNALPIIITHGWPGSVLEFMEIIEPLSDPTAHGGRAEDAFDVVAPSMPGFGFSDKPSARGWNADRIARAWSELMRRLGYKRYVAQGGDWGAFVTTKMAQQHASGLAAIHLNFPQVVPDHIPAKLTAEQQRAIDALKRFESDGSGYFLEQATRPQTIGYPLTDSPAGQAAWIYEKFHAWTDNKGAPEDALTRDQMLDDITLYWLTDTAASSARMYSENASARNANNAGVVDLPVGCSIFPREIFPAPRDWAEKVFPKLIYWNEVKRGGHFAAFEEPALFTDEMRAFARKVRGRKEYNMTTENRKTTDETQMLASARVCADVSTDDLQRGQIDPAVAKLGKGFVSYTAKVNGTTLYYVRGGTGPAVILVHGFSQDWYEFRHIMPRLAKKFTVIAIDLRGIGGSSPTPSGYDAANMAEDIHQLARQLKLERIYVAGHDIGGMVTYAFVRRYPTATRGVMILETAIPGIGRWEEAKAKFWHFAFHQTPKLPEQLLTGRQFIYFRSGFDRFAQNSKAITDADATHYANSYAAPEQLRAGLEFYRAFPANEQFNAAQRSALEVPIVLAGGDKTAGPTLPRTADSLREHGCANVTVEVIKNSGHFVSEEQPERVADLIEHYASVETK